MIWRPLSLVLGLGTLVAVWLGPLPAMADQLFVGHMLMHVMVVAVAAPLLAIGIAGSRFDPSSRMPVLFSPILASVIELFVVWAWHVPALHHAARASQATQSLEQGSYLFVGLLVWLAAFGGDRNRRALAGIAGLLLTSMHMTLLGVLLTMASRPLFEHSGSALSTLSPLEDQQMGGIIMLAFGGTSYLIGGLYLLAGLLQDKRNAVSLG
ncbi:cytochrome c oxidase assembly protein [Stutzerimonas nosocomialis]|uniref:Cytochrome c oxidase assembly protein n=1 Tax=Stutzerimonas nosocomialis TaxID=1056496 RepID=A0A5R9QE90_9GAMM|nr:cytochrome c oxidase assembly protein [Stutzerimonas nosocomialis]TLX54272.1 cytochrome c oxidase assembly protein [Stutzerimonas nosocomialis]TLX58768.1 cytochrome c oxidase assembly protein [Stutzerimonas nosocomialis]TLX63260.1 cytochrome c oxidase assembly protein [Stutzerimonas nosocomialis]